LVSTEEYTSKGSTVKYETVYNLFTPVGDQAQYAICSPIMDEYGNIYFKNDSAYLMAVGSTIEKLEIKTPPEKLSYNEGEVFDGSGMTVTAVYTNGVTRDVTEYVTWSEEPLTGDDTDFMILFPHVMYQNMGGEEGVTYDTPMVPLKLTITAESADIIYGDVNDDGEVTMKDVSGILQYINKKADLSDDQILKADVNTDGEISMRDISFILQYINKDIESLPVKN